MDANSANVELLLIDDQAEAPCLLHHMLNIPNYTLVTASSPRAALERIRSCRFSLFIINTNASDGYELARRLRQSEQCEHVPILFIADQHTSVHELERGYALGAVEYIHRPLQAPIVRAKVANAVALHQKTELAKQQAHRLRHSEQLGQMRDHTQEAINRPLETAGNEGRQTEQELRTLLSRTKALYSVARSIVAVERLPEMLQIIVDSVASALPADLIAIVNLDLHTEAVIDVVVGGQRAEQWHPVTFENLMDGLTGQALRNVQPVLYLDGVRDPRSANDAIPFGEPDLQEGSVIVVPLRFRERTLGVMIAINWGPNKKFTQQDVELMDAMAGQSAAAIENARLFDEMHGTLQRVQHIINTVPAGVALLDGEHHVLQANPRAQEHLKQVAELHGGTRITHLGGEPITTLLAKASKSGRTITLAGASNRLFEFAARSFQTDTQGKQWVAILRDVTQERAAQEHLQAQQRQATVGQLAAGIAHDFNNILAVISLYSQMLRNRTLDSHSARQLDIIRKQSERGAGLVRQILDFSSRSILEFTSLDLIPFLQEILVMLGRALPDSIQLRLNLHLDAAYVHVDPTRLQQVFMNLAINARDAMPQGGELCIDIAPLTLPPHQRPPLPKMPAGQWVQISVADTGCGIPAEIHEKLFEPFFTTKAPDKGTGLGLAQVYGIIQQLDGFIAVSSRVDQGATFTIYLPRHDAPPQASPNGASDSASHSPAQKTILLVEDNAEVRQALADMLEELGYKRVIVAENGWDALQHVRNRTVSIDLILSDMVMPKMGGLELYKTLRTEQSDIKMIISTGYPLEDGGEELLAQGIVDWVQKPFTRAEIERKIHKALVA